MSYPTILRLAQVMQRVGLRRSSIYSLMRTGQFPAAIKLGPRSVGWIEAEVHSWLSGRIEASRPNAG
jgi:prophage regulatory protein